jgi:hypothetical protein
MNRENVRRVRDHIASLPPEQVNMGTVVSERECGTVACIAGWCLHLFGEDLGSEALGISDGRIARLITPPGWSRDRERPEHEKLYPKARVVATLDHLLATGEVDWNAGQEQAA